jgi:hypothetical protein
VRAWLGIKIFFFGLIERQSDGSDSGEE